MQYLWLKPLIWETLYDLCLEDSDDNNEGTDEEEDEDEDEDEDNDGVPDITDDLNEGSEEEEEEEEGDQSSGVLCLVPNLLLLAGLFVL